MYRYSFLYAINTSGNVMLEQYIKDVILYFFSSCVKADLFEKCLVDCPWKKMNVRFYYLW